MKCPNCDIDILKLCEKCGFQHFENHTKIHEMYVFVTVDEHGNEGIPALKLGATAFPMVVHSAASPLLEALKRHAVELSQKGSRVKLLKFTTRTEVEEF